MENVQRQSQAYKARLHPPMKNMRMCNGVGRRHIGRLLFGDGDGERGMVEMVLCLCVICKSTKQRQAKEETKRCGFERGSSLFLWEVWRGGSLSWIGLPFCLIELFCPSSRKSALWGYYFTTTLDKRSPERACLLNKGSNIYSLFGFLESRASNRYLSGFR